MKRTALALLALCSLAAPLRANLASVINPLNRTFAQETTTTGNFIGLADLQAIVTAKASLASAAVFDCESTVSGNVSVAEPDYANAGLTISGMTRYGRVDASAAGLNAMSSGLRFGFVNTSETWTLTPKDSSQVVTHFGAVFGQWRVGADLSSVVATFTDGSTETYTSTVAGPVTGGPTTYEFVGFQAPAGLGISKIQVLEVNTGDWVAFDDVTFVVGPPRSSDPYGDWAAAHGLTGADAGQMADPDGDGVLNVVEFMLASDPKLGDAGGSGAPTVFPDPTNLVLVYTRSKAAPEAGFVPIIEYSQTLAPESWTPATPAMTSVIPDAAAELVTVTIPKPPGAAFLCARLRVVSPEP